MQLKVISLILVLALIAPLNAFFTYNFHQPINLHHKLKPVTRSLLRQEESFVPSSADTGVKSLPFGYLQDAEIMRRNDYFWNNA